MMREEDDMSADMTKAIGGKCGCINCKPRSNNAPAVVKKVKANAKAKNRK